MRNLKLKSGRWIVLCLTLIMLLLSSPFLSAADASEVTTGQVKADAVSFIQDRFESGDTIDPYTAWVLTKVGEDLDSEGWTNVSGKTLKAQVEDLADLMSDHNTLVSYICQTQNADGSFGPYANEYGTKAPLEALASIRDDEVPGEVTSAITAAEDYFSSRYCNGTLQYDATGFTFDYRCVEALALAGVDLTTGDWVYGGKSLQETVLDAAYVATENRDGLDTVSLAKHLSVFTAVDPECDEVCVLADTIACRQNSDGHFGSSVYDHVLVLTALGKAGALASIEQEKAHNYLLGFKQEHTDVFGSLAGWAWGSNWDGSFTEEPDLTAQVVGALSFFDEAANPSSDVYNSIQNGLAYLRDVQDPDTAAIRAQWDSTFASAETLLALKRLGLSYDEYAGEHSLWSKESRTKTVAQCLLAVDGWNDSVRRDQLVNLLQGRQIPSGAGQGTFENSVYSDMWAFIALGEALSQEEFASVVDKNYVLAKQSPDTGAWGETFLDSFYADLLSTTQALRVLYRLPDAANDLEIQNAVAAALAYLKGQQQADGSVCAPWDDPAVDNSEVVATLKVLGKDSTGSEWTVASGSNPFSYLLTATRNADGSFGTARNLFGATEVLFALSFFPDDYAWQVPSDDSGVVTPTPDRIAAEVAVVGPGGGLLFGPETVNLEDDNPWGPTALGALDATGLDYYAYNNGFVTSIAGVANSGMSGWMYKVNDIVPSVAANEKILSEDDRVIWWYSDDPGSKGPVWADLNTAIPVAGDLSEEQQQQLAALVGLLQGVVKDSTCTGILDNEPMGEDEQQSVINQLKSHMVSLRTAISPGPGGLVADQLMEVVLWIGPGSLEKQVEATVVELQAEDAALVGLPLGKRLISGIYDLEPDGLNFQKDTLLLIRCFPGDQQHSNMLLLHWNPERQVWQVIPAVYDPGTGLLGAQIDHLSRYAVFLPSDSPPSVEGASWAQDAIRALTARGLFPASDSPVNLAVPVTRADFAGWITRAVGFVPTDRPGGFPDVPNGHQWAPEIARATETGLVKGHGDGTFRPEQPLTRQEMAVLLVRALEYLRPDAPAPSTAPTLDPFVDSGQVSAWARATVAKAVDEGLIAGHPDGRLAPLDPCSGTEAAAMLWRLITRIQ